MEKPKATREPLLRVLYLIIRLAVRALAVLMTIVIVLGVGDVAVEMYRRLIEPPMYVLTITDLLATFGVFMAVLIAIEIFANIVLYLRDDVIHVKLVIATALMAVARKVIVIDFAEMTPWEVVSIGIVVLATSIAYWIVHRHTEQDETPENHL